MPVDAPTKLLNDLGQHPMQHSAVQGNHQKKQMSIFSGNSRRRQNPFTWLLPSAFLAFTTDDRERKLNKVQELKATFGVTMEEVYLLCELPPTILSPNSSGTVSLLSRSIPRVGAETDFVRGYKKAAI
jgi:hypothetical protein